jgi:hypothetical protein
LTLLPDLQRNLVNRIGEQEPATIVSPGVLIERSISSD